jgi:1-phosphofructokinase
MIYTITFNPALDYTVQVEKFEIGKINRTKSENILAGGKGLNVSIILKRLGIENTALSFIAGFTGKELERKIRQYNIETEFIETNRGYTRINVKISSLEKNSLIQESETALNGNGPEITENDIEKLLQKIQNINSNDIVILSGNIPKCINENIYEIICKELDGKNVKFVVDASQKLLMNCLKYKPFFIKPNKEELEETFNTKIETKEEIIIYAKKLQEKGAQNVLISLGGDGAILLTEKNEVYYSNTPKGQVINTVGAGDSMVAGFVAGYLKKKDYKEALKLGIASGSATAFSAGLAMNEEINELLKQITIEKI